MYQAITKEEGPLCGAFAEPSDGLEPSTPSLPCAARGNRSQPTATVCACLSPFAAVRFAAVCYRLQPGGSIKAPFLVVRQSDGGAAPNEDRPPKVSRRALG